MSSISDSEYCKVVIVGAGMAGLAAANTLVLNSMSFVIVEAQDYVGGRIKPIATSGILSQFPESIFFYFLICHCLHHNTDGITVDLV